jgi:hypothetical protein
MRSERASTPALTAVLCLEGARRCRHTRLAFVHWCSLKLAIHSGLAPARLRAQIDDAHVVRRRTASAKSSCRVPVIAKVACGQNPAIGRRFAQVRFGPESGLAGVVRPLTAHSGRRAPRPPMSASDPGCVKTFVMLGFSRPTLWGI